MCPGAEARTSGNWWLEEGPEDVRVGDSNCQQANLGGMPRFTFTKGSPFLWF